MFDHKIDAVATVWISKDGFKRTFSVRTDNLVCIVQEMAVAIFFSERCFATTTLLLQSKAVIVVTLQIGILAGEPKFGDCNILIQS